MYINILILFYVLLFYNKIVRELDKENPDKVIIGRYARQLEEKLKRVRRE